MKRSRFTEEQIAYALRQAEAGTPAGDVCRQLGVSEATFYVWKKKFANLGVTELRTLRMLEEENARLKRVVADLTLDRHILQEVLRRASSSFDHLVCADHDGWWDGNSKCLGSLEIDDKLEFSCPLDRQSAGLGALENFAHKNGRPAILFEVVHPVADQAAGFREFLTAGGWKLVLLCKNRNRLKIVGKHRVCVGNHSGVNTSFDHRRKSVLKFIR